MKSPEFNPTLAKDEQNMKKPILVYMIGGITYGEVAAIRMLSKKYSNFNIFLLILYK